MSRANRTHHVIACDSSVVVAIEEQRPAPLVNVLGDWLLRVVVLRRLYTRRVRRVIAAQAYNARQRSPRREHTNASGERGKQQKRDLRRASIVWWKSPVLLSLRF